MFSPSSQAGNHSQQAQIPVAPVDAAVRKVLVINAKGGCGKTTLATNLASYYAARGKGVAMYDHDPQGSSIQWLTLRNEQAYPIHGVAAHRQGQGVTRSWLMRVPEHTEMIILDAPAGVHGMQLLEMVRSVDSIIIPVQPSPMDIHATSRFIQDLLLVGGVRNHQVRVGVVANRVRTNTKVYQSLKKFLNSLMIPMVGTFRDSQYYVQSAEEGLGIHELRTKHRMLNKEKRQWDEVIKWLEG